MSHSFWRFVVSLVLAPLLALPAALAPEHVHEADGDHPHAIAHRHFEPHHLASQGHDGAEFDHGDGDGHIVWLDSVGARQSAYELPMPCLVCVAHFNLAPAVARRIATPVDDTAPLHGPPRLARSLRAPPSPPSDLI